MYTLCFIFYLAQIKPSGDRYPENFASLLQGGKIPRASCRTCHTKTHVPPLQRCGWLLGRARGRWRDCGVTSADTKAL